MAEFTLEQQQAIAIAEAKARAAAFAQPKEEEEKPVSRLEFLENALREGHQKELVVQLVL
jgi:hypothetical protein